MGVGTNVQDIAIALHHLDCPWRPADVAQREGRILRQRNKHPQVHIYRYVTERSFDAYMWQTVTRKAKFIDQVIHGKTTGRDAKDIGGDMAALSYSEVTALATGDMRILVKAKADSEVQRLERLESAWRRTRQHLKTKISDSAQSAARLTDVAAQLGSALERRVDTRGDAFTMRLDGRRSAREPTPPPACAARCTPGSPRPRKAPAPAMTTRTSARSAGSPSSARPPGAPATRYGRTSFDGVPVPAVRISETGLGLAPAAARRPDHPAGEQPPTSAPTATRYSRKSAASRPKPTRPHRGQRPLRPRGRAVPGTRPIRPARRRTPRRTVRPAARARSSRDTGPPARRHRTRQRASSGRQRSRPARVCGKPARGRPRHPPARAATRTSPRPDQARSPRRRRRPGPASPGRAARASGPR